ncbi:Glycosyltransferase WbuB [Candidatus Desulfarcum epimagneticum]|uniref:Glycosyltransferase WbuB n=1 Tax=uncultured Desulfobacteraceae bacterium TaxID=218296 RepID=A0A484HJ56_9BACT|nr:Glycosyltransferase WbuB [uncultured Desulfobacteraceae bacterium]
MKILFLSQFFWPEDFRINDIAISLKKRGHEVTVLTGIPNYPYGHYYEGYGLWKKRREDFNGIKIFRAPLFPRRKGRWWELIINYLSFMFFACFSVLLFSRKKIDIIFFNQSPFSEGMPAIFLKIFTKAKLIYWAQDLWPRTLSATGNIRSKKVLKIIDMFIRLIYSRCDLILAQSHAFIKEIINQGAEPDIVSYFPNSAEKLYQPVVVKKDSEKRKLMPGGFCVTFAGNIGAAQDFETILGAAEILKNNDQINWVILGMGRMFSWVESQVEKRGLEKNVRLLGRRPMETMPEFFALSDALLAILKKEPIFAFTIPGKIQSYLACAKPVIVAMEGEGARIVTESGAGFACPPENPKSLAMAVLKMSNLSDVERKKMGRKGRKYFNEHFEPNNLLKRLETWMSELKR